VSSDTFLPMKKYKVKEVIKFLEAEGWVLITQRGSHRQFKHPIHKGKVTVNGKPNDVLDQELLNSIWKQAGWR
jgi:predicted RNA binding protein YcfA (HicA-like mRNA interferase family)